jgi:hypothetical protein
MPEGPNPLLPAPNPIPALAQVPAQHTTQFQHLVPALAHEALPRAYLPGPLPLHLNLPPAGGMRIEGYHPEP